MAPESDPQPSQPWQPPGSADGSPQPLVPPTEAAFEAELAAGSIDDPPPPPSTEVDKRTHPLTGLLQGFVWGAVVASAFGFQQLRSTDGVLQAAIAVIVGFLLGISIGWFSWLFTRYTMTPEELRIDRGLLFRSSRRIPYERIQSVDINEPLIARIAGLSELTIEMAGGSESKNVLRYFRLTESRRLRRLLLIQAHGETNNDSANSPLESDESASNQDVITVVPGDRIILGSFMSLDFALTTALGLIGLGITLSIAGFGMLFSGGQGQWTILFGALPIVAGAAQLINSRILQQWGFTLSRTPRGLRIERGLLSRSSQTIPYDRVQGIARIEPCVWRRFRWARLEVDVAGYGAAASTDDGVSSNTLLPIGDKMLAQHIVDELVPDAERSQYTTLRAPDRSKIFAPIGWKYRSARTTQHTVSTKSGWVSARTNIVPHHKVQSVAITQGPWQRRRSLASVQIHTPDGPVDAELRNFGMTESRALAFEQTALARQARSAAADAALGSSVDTAIEEPRVEPTFGQDDTFR